jgi:hypothetical protein
MGQNKEKKGFGPSGGCTTLTKPSRPPIGLAYPSPMQICGSTSPTCKKTHPTGTVGVGWRSVWFRGSGVPMCTTPGSMYHERNTKLSNIPNNWPKKQSWLSTIQGSATDDFGGLGGVGWPYRYGQPNHLASHASIPSLPLFNRCKRVHLECCRARAAYRRVVWPNAGPTAHLCSQHQSSSISSAKCNFIGQTQADENN